MRRSLMIVIVSVVGLAACRKDATPSATASTSLAEDGVDASDLESAASALTATNTLTTTTFAEPLRAAMAARVSTKSLFLPAGCVTTDPVDPSDPAKVVHDFRACTGPWGLVRFTGRVTVRYATVQLASGPALQLEVTGDALAMRRAVADFHATATISADGANRTMVYKAELSGTTQRGRALTRTAEWTESWKVGEQCLALDGTTEGTVGERTLTTTITHYSRCRAECPAEGGIIRVESSKTGESVSITYSGGPSAHVTSSNGSEHDVALACGL